MSDAAARPWLAHPVLDASFGIGALTIVVAVAAWAFGASPWLAPGLVVAALLLDAPHVALVAMRGWKSARASTVVLVVGALVLAAAHVVWPVLLGFTFTTLLTLTPLHQAAQSHAIARAFLQRGGTIDVVTGRLLRATTVLWALAAIVLLHVGTQESLLWRVGVTTTIAWPIVGTLFGVGVVLLTIAFVRLRGNTGRLQAAGVVKMLGWWLALPLVFVRLGGTPATALGLGLSCAALLHGAQGLWWHLVSERRAAGRAGRSIDVLGWWFVATSGGALLFVCGPWASTFAGSDLPLALLVAQASVGLMHVVMDVTVRARLRDQELGDDVRVLAGGRAQVSTLRAVITTIAGGALLAVGAVNVVEAVWVRADASDDDLLLARTLTVHDSRVFLMEARHALERNDVEGARTSLGRAVSLSPHNSDALRAQARLAFVTGRVADADTLLRSMRASDVDDPATLALRAEVALRLGHRDDAATLTARALRFASDDPEVARVGGLVAHVEKRDDDAVALLERALPPAGAQKPGKHDDSQFEALLALAEAQAAQHKHDAALGTYQRLLDVATRVDRPDLGMQALGGRARVLEDAERMPEALDAYQRALHVAPFAKLDDVEAGLWLEYATLLGRSQAPMRYRYVCVLKASSALAKKPSTTPEHQALSKAIDEGRTAVEGQLTPDEQSEARNDVDTLAKQALALTYGG